MPAVVPLTPALMVPWNHQQSNRISDTKFQLAQLRARAVAIHGPLQEIENLRNDGARRISQFQMEANRVASDLERYRNVAIAAQSRMEAVEARMTDLGHTLSAPCEKLHASAPAMSQLNSMSETANVAYTTFDAIDTNHDGVITRSEWRTKAEGAPILPRLVLPMQDATQEWSDTNHGLLSSRSDDSLAVSPSGATPMGGSLNTEFQISSLQLESVFEPEEREDKTEPGSDQADANVYNPNDIVDSEVQPDGGAYNPYGTTDSEVQPDANAYNPYGTADSEVQPDANAYNPYGTTDGEMQPDANAYNPYGTTDSEVQPDANAYNPYGTADSEVQPNALYNPYDTTVSEVQPDGNIGDAYSVQPGEVFDTPRHDAYGQPGELDGDAFCNLGGNELSSGAFNPYGNTDSEVQPDAGAYNPYGNADSEVQPDTGAYNPYGTADSEVQRDGHMYNPYGSTDSDVQPDAGVYNPYGNTEAVQTDKAFGNAYRHMASPYGTADSSSTAVHSEPVSFFGQVDPSEDDSTPPAATAPPPMANTAAPVSFFGQVDPSEDDSTPPAAAAPPPMANTAAPVSFFGQVDPSEDDSTPPVAAAPPPMAVVAQDDGYSVFETPRHDASGHNPNELDDDAFCNVGGSEHSMIYTPHDPPEGEEDSEQVHHGGDNDDSQDPFSNIGSSQHNMKYGEDDSEPVVDYEDDHDPFSNIGGGHNQSPGMEAEELDTNNEDTTRTSEADPPQADATQPSSAQSSSTPGSKGLPPKAPQQKIDDTDAQGEGSQASDSTTDVPSTPEKAEDKKEEVKAAEERPSLFRRFSSGLGALFGRGENAVPKADLSDESDWYYDDVKKCWQCKGAETDGNTAAAAPPPKAIKTKRPSALDTSSPASSPAPGGESSNDGFSTPGFATPGVGTPRSRLRSRYVDVPINHGAASPAPGQAQASAVKDDSSPMFPVRPVAPPAGVMMFMPSPKPAE